TQSFLRLCVRRTPDLSCQGFSTSGLLKECLLYHRTIPFTGRRQVEQGGQRRAGVVDSDGGLQDMTGADFRPAQNPGYRHIFPAIRPVRAFVAAMIALYQNGHVASGSDTGVQNLRDTAVGVGDGVEIGLAHPAVRVAAFVRPTEIDEEKIEGFAGDVRDGGRGDVSVALRGVAWAETVGDIQAAGRAEVAQFRPVKEKAGSL